MRQQIQLAGICLAGLVSVGLAVVKQTSAAHWSWWRVLLPLGAVLGQNILYITVGLIWISFSEYRSGEEATIRPDQDPYGYQLGSLLFVLILLDSLLQRIEGLDGNGTWLGLRGSWELVLVCGVFSVTCQLIFWSQIVRAGDRKAGDE